MRCGVTRGAGEWKIGVGETERRLGRRVEREAGGEMAAGRDGGGGTLACSGGNGDVLVVGPSSGGGTDACSSEGGSGDGGWTPSPTFREQPLEREKIHFHFSNDG